MRLSRGCRAGEESALLQQLYRLLLLRTHPDVLAQQPQTVRRHNAKALQVLAEKIKEVPLPQRVPSNGHVSFYVEDKGSARKVQMALHGSARDMVSHLMQVLQTCPGALDLSLQRAQLDSLVQDAEPHRPQNRGGFPGVHSVHARPAAASLSRFLTQMATPHGRSTLEVVSQEHEIMEQARAHVCREMGLREIRVSSVPYSAAAKTQLLVRLLQIFWENQAELLPRLHHACSLIFTEDTSLPTYDPLTATFCLRPCDGNAEWLRVLIQAKRGDAARAAAFAKDLASKLQTVVRRTAVRSCRQGLSITTHDYHHALSKWSDQVEEEAKAKERDYHSLEQEHEGIVGGAQVHPQVAAPSSLEGADLVVESTRHFDLSEDTGALHVPRFASLKLIQSTAARLGGPDAWTKARAEHASLLSVVDALQERAADAFQLQELVKGHVSYRQYRASLVHMLELHAAAARSDQYQGTETALLTSAVREQRVRLGRTSRVSPDGFLALQHDWFSAWFSSSGNSNDDEGCPDDGVQLHRTIRRLLE